MNRQQRQAQIQATLEAAINQHRAGNLSAAEGLYRAILSQDPRHVDALQLLGVMAQQTGQLSQAEQLLRTALKYQPGNAVVLANLGGVLLSADRPAEALPVLRKAVQIRPDYPEAENNLGLALQDCHHSEDAAGILENLLKRHPLHVHAMVNLAQALQVSNPDRAYSLLQQALQLAPALPAAHQNLGSLMLDQGRYDAAEKNFRAALALDPNSAKSHYTLGYCLMAQHRGSEGEPHLHQALALRPDYPEALAALGNWWMTTRGLATTDQDHSYRQGLELLRRAVALAPDNAAAHSNLIFQLDFDPTADIGAQQHERREWYRRHGQSLAPRQSRHANDRTPDRPLRVGYVSADFCRHSAAYIFGAILAHHDRTQVTAIGYSSTKVPDAMTETLKTYCQEWREVRRLSDGELDRLIRADQIDILIDLSAHSEGARLPLFARKPAPIQLSGWGHANGTGLPQIDGLISDAVCIDAADRHQYVEPVIDMPCAITWAAPAYLPQARTEAQPDGTPITFGSFNRAAKISRTSLESWAEILRQTPGSVLLLKDAGWQDTNRCRDIRQAMMNFGLDGERIHFAGGTPHQEHLAAFHQVDIALDPFPYGGGVSTCDALAMGVPVIALLGRTVTGRSSAGIVTAIGRPDLVAHTIPDYVALAVALAADKEKCAAERSKIRQAFFASPVGDPTLYTRCVERLYRELWYRWIKSP